MNKELTVNKSDTRHYIGLLEKPEELFNWLYRINESDKGLNYFLILVLSLSSISITLDDPKLKKLKWYKPESEIK